MSIIMQYVVVVLIAFFAISFIVKKVRHALKGECSCGCGSKKGGCGCGCGCTPPSQEQHKEGK